MASFVIGARNDNVRSICWCQNWGDSRGSREITISGDRYSLTIIYLLCYYLFNKAIILQQIIPRLWPRGERIQAHNGREDAIDKAEIRENILEMFWINVIVPFFFLLESMDTGNVSVIIAEVFPPATRFTAMAIKADHVTHWARLSETIHRIVGTPLYDVKKP